MGRQVDVAIIRAGTARLNAVAKVRQASRSFGLVNSEPLSATCASAGCMLQKALIQVVDDFHRLEIFDCEALLAADSLRIGLSEAIDLVRDLRQSPGDATRVGRLRPAHSHQRHTV